MTQHPKIVLVVLVFAGALFASPPCRATDKSMSATISLSIEDAVFIGLENSHDLQVQKLQPVISGAFEDIERGVFSPELISNFQYGRARSTETARSTEDQFSVEGSEISGGVGIRQNLPIGMEIETTADIVRSESSRTPTQNTTRIGLGVTQQLLSGLGPTVNLASLRLAALDTKADRYELHAFAQAMIADIETTYWRYVAATEAITAVEKASVVALAQLDVVETRIEVGALPENERAAALSEVSLRKQALIDATAYRNLERYRLLAKLYPDHPAHRVQTLTAISPPEVTEKLLIDPDASIALALKSRPEIAEANLRLQKGNLEIAVTKNGALPKLELFIQLGKSGYADSFTGSIKDIIGPNYDFTTGLRLRHFIGNRAAKAEEKIARTTLQQAQEALANLRTLVRTDVLVALNELERAHAQVAAAGDTARFREQALAAEQAKYEAGAGTLLAVTLAQRDLLQSRIDEIKAEVAYRIAKTELYRAEGTLLARRGISVGP